MFVAPAADLDEERMLRAKGRLEERGYRVEMRDDLFAVEGYLAGSDERRAEELMQAFLDPEVQAIFPGTGGYGTMRILDRLDYGVIRAHPKILIGFSDITALHLAIQRQAGVGHLPLALPDVGPGQRRRPHPVLRRVLLAGAREATRAVAERRGYTVDDRRRACRSRCASAGAGSAAG